MGGGAPRFSLSDLPARFREQVVSKIYPETKRPAALAGAKPKSERKRKAKRTTAPIRMKKCAGGMNKTEAQFNRDILLGKGRYEVLTLHLAGGDYTPDFFFVNPEDGEICLFEIKGSYRLPTHGRSVFAFKQACKDYPMFRFMFAELSADGRTWTIGSYKDGMEVGVVRGTAAELHEMKV